VIDQSLTAPVLLIAFNRPETTRRVLNEIARAAPGRLFVAVDGPREGHPDDRTRCADVLETIRNGIHWKCDAEYLVRKTNLGCGRAPASAISWFFENVEEGIILEDDCLPVPQFFPFCTSLLRRYREESRVAHIGGFNCQSGRKRGDASYYFSRYFHCWGWASWGRAWDGFDVEMKDYPEFLAERRLERLFPRRSVREFWKDNFDEAAHGDGSVWDYQWVYLNFKKDRLAVVPNWNMIENIGFGSGATHTRAHDRRMPAVADDIPSEIVHSTLICPSDLADDYTYRHHLRLGHFHDLKQLVKRLLRFKRASHA
jgi:hypothetical protein